MALELIVILHNRTGKELDKKVAAQMVRAIKEEFRRGTESLSDQALADDSLTIGDLSDAIMKFYTALPKGTF